MILNPTTEKFVLHWGEMGTCGVNRSVAQIHALLFILGKPMNCGGDCGNAEPRALRNVNNSIKELQSLKLVQVTHQLGDRRDYFTTSDDVWALARTIIEERQRRKLSRRCIF